MLWSSAVGLKDGGAVVTAAPEVLYAPEDKPADRLVALYEGARHSIYIATYGYVSSCGEGDRKSTRLNSSHSQISYAVFCLKKKKITICKSSRSTGYLNLTDSQ